MTGEQNQQQKMQERCTREMFPQYLFYWLCVTLGLSPRCHLDQLYNNTNTNTFPAVSNAHEDKKFHNSIFGLIHQTNLYILPFLWILIMFPFRSLTLCIATHMRMVKQSAQFNVTENIPWLLLVLKITNTPNQMARINKSCFQVLSWVPMFWLCQRCLDIFVIYESWQNLPLVTFSLYFGLWCIYTLLCNHLKAEYDNTRHKAATPWCPEPLGAFPARGGGTPLLPLLTLLHLTASSLDKKM